MAMLAERAVCRTGKAPFHSPAQANNHLSLYSQPMTITDGGLCTMGSVSGTPLARFNAGQTKQWGPTDVQTALGGSGHYGILGFRSATI